MDFFHTVVWFSVSTGSSPLKFVYQLLPRASLSARQLQANFPSDSWGIFPFIILLLRILPCQPTSPMTLVVKNRSPPIIFSSATAQFSAKPIFLLGLSQDRPCPFERRPAGDLLPKALPDKLWIIQQSKSSRLIKLQNWNPRRSSRVYHLKSSDLLHSLIMIRECIRKSHPLG